MKKIIRLGTLLISALGLMISLSLITQVHGQEITGSIVGIVKDSNGAAVAGATVTIKDTDKNIVVRTLTTNSDGEYSAPFLPVSHYSVIVEAANFKKFNKTGIQLNVNDRLTIDAEMTVGAVTEEVTVQATATQIELQSATSGTVVSTVEVRELPLNSRVYLQLLNLMPGVSSGSSDQLYIGTTNPSGQTNTVQFAINGGRSSENSFTVDGADNVDRGSNLTLLTTPSVDAIAEFKVIRNHYSAEYGRNASGQVSVITKSGSSQFHGNAYEFLRNDKLNANTYFNGVTGTARPPLRYNNFGYTFGGPVFIPGVYNENKDKTFFFFSQEYHRIVTYNSLTPDVPNANERLGIFATPVCISPVVPIAPNSTITTCTTTKQINNIDPVSAAYIKDIYAKMPLPNAPALGATKAVIPVLSIFNHRQDLIRIDHNFNPKVTLSFRYLNDSIPTVEPGGLFTGALLPGVSTTVTNSPGHSFVTRSVQTLRPTLINEVGYSFSYGAIISDSTGLVLSANSPDIKVTLPSPTTLNRIPGLAPGFSAVAGFGPYRDFNRNHNIFDNVNKTIGSHSLKFGGSFNFYQKTENAAGNNTGSYAFSNTRSNDGTTTGTGAIQQQWANFLLGNVATFTQTSADLTPDVRSRQYEFYAQDDYRFRSNLTVNVGVRYSLFRQPFDKNGQLTTFDPSAYNPAHAVGIDPVTGNKKPCVSPCDPLNGIIVAGGNSPFGNKVGNENNKDFAPVLGFAWDPFKDGKTSIRAGYGISYDTALVGIVEQNIFANPPAVNNISISNTNMANPGLAAPSTAAPLSLRATPPDTRTPYIQQWSLDVQREIRKDFIVDVGYFGTKGTHLLGIVDLNLLKPGQAVAAGLAITGGAVTAATTAKLNQIRPYLGYVAINSIEDWFNSNYNSLQMSAEKRFSAGSLIKVAYTWSHNLTDNQSDRSNAPQNFYDRAAEYGPASFDRRHIFTVDYVYELPFFKGEKGIKGLALGGWQISGITSYASGVPLTVTTTGTDPAGLGFLGTSASGGRPDQVGDPNANAPHTRLSWFNIAAFATTPGAVHRPGTTGRGTVLGPGFGRWDIAFGKSFRITERIQTQFRAEMFNAFNHTNFLAVSTTFTALNFGQVTTAHDPRIVQLGLKLYF